MLMITGASVPQSAPLGTVVGMLHCYTSGTTVPCIFRVDNSAHGEFTIAKGNQLVTAATELPVGHHALKIEAIANAPELCESARFIVEVTAPPAPAA
jgi:hypothetical protein